MPDATPRRWFHLHLSTVLLLLFAASGIVWLNIRGYQETRTITAGSVLGWPWLVEEKLPVFYSESGIEFSRWRIVLNLVAAFGALWLAALAAEFIFHRRDRAPLLPPRRWFRVHLSSMLSAMFTIALLLWINFRQVDDQRAAEFPSYSYGWPEIAAHLLPRRTLDGFGVSGYDRIVRIDALAADLAVGALLVLAVVVLGEFIVRRRAARRAARQAA